MLGDKVVVRGTGDVALVRYVVEVNKESVYITDNKGLAELASAGTTRRMIGMAPRRVFRYDPAVQDGKEANWAKMRLF